MLSQTTSTHSFSWSDWGLLVCSLCFMFVSSPCVLPAFSPYLSLSPPHLLGCVVQSVSWAGAWCIYSREERLMGFSSSSNAGCFWVCVEWIQRNSMGSCSGPLWWMDVLLVSLCSPLWECCSVCVWEFSQLPVPQSLALSVHAQSGEYSMHMHRLYLHVWAKSTLFYTQLLWVIKSVCIERYRVCVYVLVETHTGVLVWTALLLSRWYNLHALNYEQVRLCQDMKP